jgi:hypothetical protein
MRSPRRLKPPTLALAVSALLWLGGGQASAGNMTLTPAGIAQGFTLSTFASGFPTNNDPNPLIHLGPIGIAYPGGGVVLVSDNPNGNVYRFPTDTDGQTASPGIVLGNYGKFNPEGLVSFNGTTAMALYVAGQLVTLDPITGSTSLIVGGLPKQGPIGVEANPLNGHYFVSVNTANGLVVDVNPFTNTFTPFGGGADGLTISPDGKTLYEAGSLGLLGLDTATGKLVFQSSPIPFADGSALGFGKLAGKAYVNERWQPF